METLRAVVRSLESVDKEMQCIQVILSSAELQLQVLDWQHSQQ